MSMRAPTSTPCVGSSTSRTCGWLARTLASTSFCWLPPERKRIGVSIDAVLTAKSATAWRALSASLRALSRPEVRSRPRLRTEKFSRTGRSAKMPS